MGLARGRRQRPPAGRVAGRGPGRHARDGQVLTGRARGCRAEARRPGGAAGGHGRRREPAHRRAGPGRGRRSGALRERHGSRPLSARAPAARGPRPPQGLAAHGPRRGGEGAAGVAGGGPGLMLAALGLLAPTWRAVLAGGTALAAVLVLGRWLIPLLAARQIVEETRKGDSQRLDALQAAKRNTPTLGGLI